MSDVAIRVRGLGKRYQIGSRQKEFHTLRGWLGSLGQRLRGWRSRARRDRFIWALRDIDFDVRKGESVGLIGKNGAGKSTLLKILSRITEPSAGEATVHGRVGSLLEVGTGFHPELTGRENVFLNGSILGMRQAEIRRKFDEIVDFSGVEKFIDTPVKRYSSGMKVRLAFAVAAHLETEILLIDEVLAVGDVEFQERCLGKMEDVTHQGRTVLFVSHSMPVVQTLCDRTILIEDGRLVADGPTPDTIERYLMGGEEDRRTLVQELSQSKRSAGTSKILVRAWTENDRGEPTARFLMGEPVTIAVEYRFERPVRNPGFGFGFETAEGLRVFSFNNYMASRRALVPPSEGVCRCRLPDPRLLGGKYWISLSVVEDENEWVDLVERALPLTIVPADVYGTGTIPERGQGLVWSPAEIDVS